MKMIGREDVIFSSPAFLMDSVLFNLFALIRESPSPILLSNGESAVIAQSAPGTPMWVWSAGGLSAAAVGELRRAAENALFLFAAGSITAKPGFCDGLAFGALGLRRPARHILAYRCDAPRPCAGASGRLYKPRAEDLPAVAGFLAEDRAESSETRKSARELLPAAGRLIADPDFYLWKDEEGIPVSMARVIHRGMGQARINTVFTHPEHRNRGYAGMLVCRLCEKIRSERLIPMLYTDAENPAANRAYRKIGFTECGGLEVARRGGLQGPRARM